MLNKVMLIGNVGKDPDVRYFDNGVAKASFSLATTESYKNKEGQRIEQTEWHNVVVWRGLAEVVEKYVKKGDKLFIEGKIKTRSYDDKDGNKKYITEIFTDNMNMLGGKKSDSSNPAQTANEQAPDYHADAPHEGDDLPF